METVHLEPNGTSYHIVLPETEVISDAGNEYFGSLINGTAFDERITSASILIAGTLHNRISLRTYTQEPYDVSVEIAKTGMIDAGTLQAINISPNLSGYEGASVINHGTVQGQWGISLLNGQNYFSNTGFISTSYRAVHVSGLADAEIHNSGFIAAESSNALNLRAGNLIFTNSGTIVGRTSAGSITTETGFDIRNSGTIESISNVGLIIDSESGGILRNSATGEMTGVTLEGNHAFVLNAGVIEHVDLEGTETLPATSVQCRQLRLQAKIHT